MKAFQILAWMLNESIPTEDCGFIDIPATDDRMIPQDLSWWMHFCGGWPDKMAEPGKYFYYYKEQHEEIIDNDYNAIPADVEVNNGGNNGYFTPMYLYRIDDASL